MPAYVSAASDAAADDSANAFTAPRRSPRPKDSGTPNIPPPPAMPAMPGYGAAPGAGNAFSQIPAPPPVIASAPSASVVAAGFPVQQPAAMPEPMRPAQAVADVAPGPNDLLMTLHVSLYPSQREWAADRLTACDWRSNPQVVDGLVKAARNDPAPLVRAGCVRALARMHASSEPAIAAVRDLRADADARVRQEAEDALAALQVVRPVRLRD
jgi:hypothetical protein